MRLLLIFFSLFAGYYGTLKGQYLHTSYSLPDEIRIEQLWEDHLGFIWGVSKERLYRFDGIHWEALFEQEIETKISSWTQQRDGKIWIGCENGEISWIEGGKLQKLEHPGLTMEIPITGLVFDQKDRLWITTYGNGLFCLAEEKLHHWESLDEIPSKDIYDISLDGSDHIWVGTDRGLAIYTCGKKVALDRLISVSEGLPDPLITSLTSAHDGGMWVGMYDGGVAYVKSINSTPETFGSWTFGTIKKMIDSNGTLWIGTLENGLFQLHSNEYSQLKEVSSKQIKALLLDQERNLWVSDEKGLNLYAIDFRFHFQRLGKVRSVISAEEGLWIASAQGVFQVFPNKDSAVLIKGTDSLHVVSLYLDSFDRLWIGTMGDGGWRYDLHTKKLSAIFSPDGSPYPHIISIMGKENQVWLATFGGAYYCQFLDDKELIDHYQTVDGVEIAYTYQVFRDSKDRIWVATDGQGVGLWEKNAFHLIPELIGQSIYSIAEDMSGQIWFSSEDSGLYAWQPDILKRIDLAIIGKSSIKPTGIVAINKSSLLFIHPDGMGIYSLTKDEYIELGKKWELPSMGDGLNAICTDSQGVIWLGTSEGVMSYSPKVSKNRNFPEPRITSVMVNLEPIDLSEPIFLDYDQNDLTIKYTGIWNQAPDQISFQHRLVGLTDEWENSRNYQAIYPQLDPGAYTFEIRLSPASSTILSHKEQITFHISSPVWTQGWFVFLMTFTLGMGIFLWVKSREKSLKRKEQLEKKAVEYHFETLQHQINPHFLFNSLTTLIGIIEENPVSAVDYVEKLADFFRHLLEYRHRSSIPLWEEKKLLDTYASLLKERFGEGFKLKWEVDSDLMNQKLPPLSLQLLVENACKHNIVSRRRPLIVRIQNEGDHTLIIRNNLQKRKSPQSSTHIGLQNLIDRYHLLSKQEVGIKITAEDYIISLPFLP